MHDATVVPPYVAKPLQMEPFRSLRLASNLVGDPAALRAFSRPYREVADRLMHWRAEGRICEDAEPAVYVHEFTSHGLTVVGIVGLLALGTRTRKAADAGVVPHEAVHPEQVDELADRMRQMMLNPAPIVLLHPGSDSLAAWVDRLVESPPLSSFEDRAGQLHRVWAERDPVRQHELNEILTSVQAIIADGHHRYAAYLSLQETDPDLRWQHGLAMLIDQSATPMHLGAIHRVINGADPDAVARAAIAAGATVETTTRPQALESLGGTTMVATNGDAWLTVTSPPDESTVPLAWALSRLLPALGADVTMTIHHTVGHALSDVGARDVALLMPALSYREVLRHLDSHGVLPEKATSFQPKPSLGVMMRAVT